MWQAQEDPQTANTDQKEMRPKSLQPDHTFLPGNETDV